MPSGLNGFEWATMIVVWLCCAIPVLSMLIVTVGAGLLGWKLVARMEAQARDHMKAILALAQSPQAHSLAGMMESTDAERDRLAAEATNGKGPRLPVRRAQ